MEKQKQPRDVPKFFRITKKLNERWTRYCDETEIPQAKVVEESIDIFLTHKGY